MGATSGLYGEFFVYLLFFSVHHDIAVLRGESKTGRNISA